VVDQEVLVWSRALRAEERQAIVQLAYFPGHGRAKRRRAHDLYAPEAHAAVADVFMRMPDAPTCRRALLRVANRAKLVLPIAIAHVGCLPNDTSLQRRNEAPRVAKHADAGC
jgi:hypothetical protein